jgi:hypothetical protein
MKTKIALNYDLEPAPQFLSPIFVQQNWIKNKEINARYKILLTEKQPEEQIINRFIDMFVDGKNISRSFLKKFKDKEKTKRVKEKAAIFLKQSLEHEKNELKEDKVLLWRFAGRFNEWDMSLDPTDPDEKFYGTSFAMRLFDGFEDSNGYGSACTFAYFFHYLFCEVYDSNHDPLYTSPVLYTLSINRA